ncbi:MAG: phosphatidate cytidylyltransferase [Sphingomonadaceae bacterium]
MAASEPIRPPAARTALGSRVVVGAFLAIVAVSDIYAGGPAFSVMIALGVALVFREWAIMHRTRPALMIAGIGVLLGVSLLAHLGRVAEALALLAVAAPALALLSFVLRRPGKRWLSTGLLYAGLPAVALIWLRAEPDGFALVMWTMGLVWATDIFAYVAGRSIGGAKIWPAVSPSKTWAGLIGGMSAAALFSALFASAVGWPVPPLRMVLLGAALAVLAQAGDFFESWLKRRAGVKDSGRLLGAHGGVMDRVDGLVPVACAVAVWAALEPGRLVAEMA